MNATEDMVLAIEVKGEVIASNAVEFREMIREQLATISRDLMTDEEFGEAELAVKGLKSAEDAVKGAKSKALADAEQLHALFSVLDDTSDEIRQARLDLEKQIKAKKVEVRAAMVADALAEIDSPHAARVFALNAEQAIKGKRTLESINKALSVMTKTANASIIACRKILADHEAEHGNGMIFDRDQLEVKNPDQVAAELRRRVDLSIAEEARKKAEAEAKALREEARKKAEEETPTEAPVKQAEPAPLPTPPKIGSIPVGNPPPPEMDSREELEHFIAILTQAFAPVKKARMEIKRPKAKAITSSFAEAVGRACRELLEARDNL